MPSENIKTEYGEFAKEYIFSKLKSLCIPQSGIQTGPFGSQLHKHDYVIVGTPIITVEHLKDNRITTQNLPFVSNQDVERLEKYKLEEGDIVFSRVGSVDRRALVRVSEVGWLYSGRCLRIRVDKEKMNPEYLAYFFGLKSFKIYIQSIAVGATMPSINTKILEDLPIYYPSLVRQNKVVNILKPIDDKLELNRRINQTLEQIAQAIFKSWFVDFEPVHAKIDAIAEGRDPIRAAMSAISGKDEDALDNLPAEKYAELQATAELFPSALVDSELGKIPEGWRITTISKMANIFKGKSYKSSELNDSRTALVTLKSFHRGGGYRLEGLKEYTGSYRMDQQVAEGDIIIACTDVTQAAEVIGKSAMVINDKGYDTLVISLDVATVQPFDDNFKPFLYGLTRTHHFSKSMEAYATGTTVLHLHKSAIPNYIFSLPTHQIIVMYAELVANFFKFKALNTHQQKPLTHLRDTLLPKLLSGEITPPDIKTELTTI